jgi:cytochrome c oxidase cbb3-type subunit I/II
MPNYPWRFTDKTAADQLPNKIAVQKRLGVPFHEQTEEEITKSVTAQETAIVNELKGSGEEIEPDREIIALISYLQKLGKSEKVTPQTHGPVAVNH